MIKNVFPPIRQLFLLFEPFRLRNDLYREGEGPLQTLDLEDALQDFIVWLDSLGGRFDYFPSRIRIHFQLNLDQIIIRYLYRCPSCRLMMKRI